MLRIIYISSSTKYLNGEEIETILSISRENNHINGITGLLLYADGDFLQVIEGPKILLIKLFESIKKDKRHTEIMTIANKEIKEKHFPNWNMGFYISNYEELRKIKGYETISKKSLSKVSDAISLAFIDSFIASHRSEFVFV